MILNFCCARCRLLSGPLAAELNLDQVRLIPFEFMNILGRILDPRTYDYTFGLKSFLMRISILLITVLFLLIGHVAAETDQSDYLVGAGDVLKISVYDNPDLDTVIRIDSNGTIQFPLIGQVNLSGMNVARVGEKIEALLSDGYLVNPQVSVFIQEYRSKEVVIMGQVNDPGVYKLSGPTNLLVLISMAGGLSEAAGDRLTINRKFSEKGKPQETIRINLQRLLDTGDPALNIQIRDQDSIFIPKAGMVYIIGEVAKPAGYKYEEGATVLKVISMAGDFAEFAAQKKVRIHRTVDGKKQTIEKVSMQEPVFPGDVIEVPESFF